MGDECSTMYKECYQYFPTEEESVMVLKSDIKDSDFKIEIKLNSIDRQEHVNKRTFDIRFSYRNEPNGPLIEGNRSMELIHFKGWVDQGMPTDPDALKALLEIAKDDCADYLRN